MGTGPSEDGTSGNGHLRAMVLGLFLFASAGTGAELVLLEHFEDWQQWIPLVLLGLGLLSGTVAAVRPGRRSLTAFRAVTGAYVAAGFAGLYLHYAGNAEFEREMYPSLTGADLVWEALTGATPSLAPGTMIGLGILGLLFTYRHPALSRGAPEAGQSTSNRGVTT